MKVRFVSQQCKQFKIQICMFTVFTGISLSEAFILTSTNPQYDKRLLIEIPVQYMKITSSEHVVYINCFEYQIKKTICSEQGIFMHWTSDSMNNLLSYCGLVDAKIRASDKDLPVTTWHVF